MYLCDYKMTVCIRQLYITFFNFQENTCVEHLSSVRNYKATLNISENKVGKEGLVLY